MKKQIIPYDIEKGPLNIVSEPIALYLSSNFSSNSIINNLTKNSIELFSNLLKNSGLTIKILAENIFEITPKTFIKYKNTSSKSPSRIAELALELNNLYQTGNDVFRNKDNFNLWLNKDNMFFNNQKPALFLNTSTGIRLIFEELKRIEFGATA